MKKTLRPFHPRPFHLLLLCAAFCLSGASAQEATRKKAPAPAAKPAVNDAMLRIACDGASKNAEVSINGEFKGDCPVDIPVAAGTLRVRVLKKVDAKREQVFEEEIRMASGTVKRIEVEFGSPKLNAQAQKEADETLKQQQAAALEQEKLAIQAREAERQEAALLPQRAQEGDMKSMLQLADQFSKNRLPESQKQAAAWYQKTADAGNPAGMGGLGAYYYKATDEPNNLAMARQWWEKGAARADPLSMNGMSLLYMTGRGGLPQDPALALKWLMKAVEGGNPKAMANLGTQHFRGSLGLQKNEAEGISWYQKAIALGNPEAMSYLGYLYEKGQGGFAKDEASALSWYRKAADLGDPEAMCNIGHLYAKGLGNLRQNQEEAVRWYQKAVDRGSAQAMFNMGAQYFNGDGVEKDRAQALVWIRKAASLGNPDAERTLEELARKGVR